MEYNEQNLQLARLEYAIEAAQADWANEISSKAQWPELENFEKKDDYFKVVDAFYEYLTGEETRNIGRLLFQLKSAPIDTVEKMEALLDAHNAQISEDLEEPDFHLRTGINRDRLEQAAMVSEGEREILLNAVSRHGAGVIHERGYWRLLVRITNHNKVNRAVNVLDKAGLIRIVRGANNAKLIVSDGVLENAHRTYLEAVRDAALEIAS